MDVVGKRERKKIERLRRSGARIDIEAKQDGTGKAEKEEMTGKEYYVWYLTHEQASESR
jgi:hypothetical protein